MKIGKVLKNTKRSGQAVKSDRRDDERSGKTRENAERKVIV